MVRGRSASEEPRRTRSRSQPRTAAQATQDTTQESPKKTVDEKPLTEFEKARIAFLTERIAVERGTNKNVRKQMLGKNLRYENCDAKTQRGLDKSRATEWKKWMDFNAGVIIEDQQLSELLDEGHKMIPTQWIETDQKDHLKRAGQYHEPDLKSRLVACGQHEDTKGIRADSPTCDVEGLNLICSFAACKKLKLKTADLKNAYFHGGSLDRLLLLRPPKGGIPGRDPAACRPGTCPAPATPGRASVRDRPRPEPWRSGPASAGGSARG